MNFLQITVITCLALASTNAAEEVVYKTVADRQLKLFIEKPEGWKPTDNSPAIVFFFGGGWTRGTPEHFRPQSTWLASRGMVGVRVEYRTIPNGDKGPPVVCCADAKSAMRYVRAHAAELGIDPRRIAGAGGSAGGHLAAFTALVEGHDDPQDDKNVSCKPDALVLFNPVFDNGPGQWGHGRVGERYMEFSPAHHITKDAPPTIVFLGDKDNLIPVDVVKRFDERMKQAGARCETHIYPDAGHGFFKKQEHYITTLAETDKFLASLGWIQPRDDEKNREQIRMTAAADAPPFQTLAVGATPESVVEGFGGKLYVTLMGVKREKGDGDGSIVMIDGDKVSVFTEGLDDPKGLVFAGGKLITTDFDTVWAINEKGEKTVLAGAAAFPKPPLFLNDVVVEPGGKSILVTEMGDIKAMFAPGGSLWPLDSDEAKRLPPLGRLYRVTLDGKASVVIDHAPEFPNPNGVDVLADGTILIAEFFRGSLLAWKNGEWRQISGDHRSGDGIVHDESGNLYLTEVRTGRVWHIKAAGGERKLLATLQSAADLILDNKNRRLIVPDSKAGLLVFIPLP